MKCIKQITGLLLCMLLLGALACTKEGPQGPAGVQGEQGPAGPKGDKGSTGAKGTANVIYSDWIKVTYTQSGSLYKSTIKVPKLTQVICDRGDVVVYVRVNNAFMKLNYESDLGYITYSFQPGSIEVLTNNGWLANFDNTFRYVLIPGGVHARLSGPVPDLNDYHAVCRYYDILE